MKLFTKGQRRYTEAKDSEILFAARDVLFKHGIKTAGEVSGMAMMLKAQEDRTVENVVLSEKHQREEEKALRDAGQVEGD